MSFDLAVWHSERALSIEEARRIYEELGENDVASGVVPNDRVRAFKKDLNAAYPDLDSLPEDQVDESPWSSGFGEWDHSVLLNIAWSRAEEMLEYVRKLAGKHGLVCYDPQEGIVYFPPSLSTPRKPWWKFW